MRSLAPNWHKNYPYVLNLSFVRKLKILMVHIVEIKVKIQAKSLCTTEDNKRGIYLLLVMLIHHSKHCVIAFCLVSAFLHILKKRYRQSKGHLEIDRENN